MYMGGWRDVLSRYADHLTVLMHWCAGGDCADCDLVTWRDVVDRGDQTDGGPDERPTRDIVHDKPDVVHPRHRHQRFDDTCRRGGRHESSSRIIEPRCLAPISDNSPPYTSMPNLSSLNRLSSDPET